jgi:membrane fusion protein, multidrug efflux system
MTQSATLADAEVIVRSEDALPGKRRLRLFLMLLVPVLLAVVGGYFYLTSGRYVSTDNAYVQQDRVSVAAEINGTIVEVAVTENQRVKKGDLLFRIDPDRSRRGRGADRRGAGGSKTARDPGGWHRSRYSRGRSQSRLRTA